MEAFEEFEDFEDFEGIGIQKALPEIYKTALIQGLCRENTKFEADTALGVLGESQAFFSELGGLFTSLYGEIGAAELFSILEGAQISAQDKKRLEVIFEIYDDFVKKIENSDYSLAKKEDRAEIFAPENLNLRIKKEIERFEKRTYIEFEDAQTEAIFIAREIAQLGKNGALWSDFGIYAQSGRQRRAFVETLSALGVPTNYGELSENFIQFRIKFEQFLNLCEAKGEEEALILENLRPNTKDLEAVREFYRVGAIGKIISLVAKNEKIDEAQIGKRVGAFLNFYKSAVGEKPDNAYVLSIIDNILYNSKNGSKNAVTIFSGTQDKNFKHLYVPSLIENAFCAHEYIHFVSQKTNEVLTAAIRTHMSNIPDMPDFEGLIPDKNAALDTKKFQDVLTRGIQSLTLSTFNYADTKQIQPSVLFDLFKNNDKENFKPDKKEEVALEVKTHQIPQGLEISGVLGADKLYLSPSAIEDFQSCPKKYYFKNILKLRERGDFLASYGSIAHAILEVFNRTCLKKYEKNEMLRLCDLLFEAKTAPETAMEQGFSQNDIDLIQATDDMSLVQMRNNFYDAAKELEVQGFFARPPDEVHCEKSFEFELSEIEGVVFKGRIDCISGNNGEYSVLDYKTGKDKKPLSYYASEYGVNFQGDYRQYTGKFNEKLIDEYDYQIPIYFLGTEFAASLAQFRGKIKDFALVYVRPQDARRDCVDTGALEGVREKIIENLKKYVVDPIKNKCEFEPKPSYGCSHCSYDFLCDRADFEDGTDD